MNQLQWWAIRTFGIPVLQKGLSYLGKRIGFLSGPNRKLAGLLERAKQLDVKSIEEMKNTVRKDE